MTAVADMNVAAVVSSYDPAGSASTSGGETVVITGSGFTGATSVGFGVYSAQFEVTSDTEIHATAPAYDPAIGGAESVAKVNVWKNSLCSDDTQQAEWTWDGQTRAQLQATSGN